jgi:hypothetical protein
LKTAFEKEQLNLVPFKRAFDICSDCLALGHFFHECPKKSMSN